MSKKRTVRQIENEIKALINEGVQLANETGTEFDVLNDTFYPGKMIKEMCDENNDNYQYLDSWYAEEYGDTGKWMSSSDFC